MSEKVAYDSVVSVSPLPANHGIPQAPSPISYPGSPPPEFQQVTGPLPMAPYHTPTMTYQQNQTAYPQQQPSFHQGMPAQQPNQQPNQQPAFNQQLSAPMPQQQMPAQARQFQTAMAIPNLGMGAAPVDCPICGTRTVTSISYHAGNTTHVWAGIICCVTGLFCFVPYLMNSLKDVQHRCGSCGTLLATWHKSGQVEQHVHA